jgi:hypothetical protein
MVEQAVQPIVEAIVANAPSGWTHAVLHAQAGRGGTTVTGDYTPPRDRWNANVPNPHEDLMALAEILRKDRGWEPVSLEIGCRPSGEYRLVAFDHAITRVIGMAAASKWSWIPATGCPSPACTRSPAPPHRQATPSWPWPACAPTSSGAPRSWDTPTNCPRPPPPPRSTKPNAASAAACPPTFGRCTRSPTATLLATRAATCSRATLGCRWRDSSPSTPSGARANGPGTAGIWSGTPSSSTPPLPIPSAAVAPTPAGCASPPVRTAISRRRHGPGPQRPPRPDHPHRPRLRRRACLCRGLDYLTPRPLPGPAGPRRIR